MQNHHRHRRHHHHYHHGASSNSGASAPVRVQCPKCRLLTLESDLGYVERKRNDVDDDDDDDNGHGDAYCDRKAKATSSSSSSSSELGGAAANDDGDDDDSRYATKSTGMYGAKIQAVLSRMLRLRAKQPGVKIVVFSQWQEVLSLLADALQRHGLDYEMPKTSSRHGFHRAIQRFKRLSPAAMIAPASFGKIEGGDPERRRKAKHSTGKYTKKKQKKKGKCETKTSTYTGGGIAVSSPSLSFSSSSNVEVGCDALLLQLKSGGQGLNLTEATHVMFVDPSLNTAQHLQAAGRVHRIGQTKPTFVHWFVIKDSIEESIYALHRQHCHDARYGAASAKEKDVLSVNDVGKLLKAKAQRKIKRR
mmetsp:Transcript_25735/g.35954  ORF Transcript_25735/g.35954 Transcript_25735/m.35954 type:complete len:362 (+) Transcript_25735:31-1116(+)